MLMTTLNDDHNLAHFRHGFCKTAEFRYESVELTVFFFLYRRSLWSRQLYLKHDRTDIELQCSHYI